MFSIFRKKTIYKNDIPKSEVEWYQEIVFALKFVFEMDEKQKHESDPKSPYYYAVDACVEMRKVEISLIKMDKITTNLIQQKKLVQRNHELLENELFAFIFCYLACHHTLKIIDLDKMAQLTVYLEEKLEKLEKEIQEWAEKKSLALGF